MQHRYLPALLGLLTLPLLGQAQQRPRPTTPAATGRPAQRTATAPQGKIVLPPVTPTLETPNFFTYTIDSLFQNLSRTPITTGILYDRVMPLAGLHAFGQGAQPDTVSAAYFRQAYLELRSAAYSRTAFPLTPDQLRKQGQRYLYRDSVALGVLDYQFNRLDTLAVKDGLLTYSNGVFQDVAKPSRSPYFTHSVAMAAALADTINSQSSFYVPQQLLLGNQGRTLTSMRVDFGPGVGERVFAPGQQLRVNFTSGGLKVLPYVLYFSDGNKQIGNTRLYVRMKEAARPSLPTELFYLNSDETFTNYDNTETLYGRGEVRIVLHNTTSQNEYAANPGNYKLRNPLIILDGYDAGDKSNLRWVYDPQGFYQLVQGAGILQAADLQERDVVLLNFPNSPRLRANGTWTADNVDGGTDYIERNALVLVALLKQLKPRLASSAEKYAIIGPSMGGLISRYALAYMEKRQAETGLASWDHNTALWVSLDAPHQGANVPIGVQEFLRYYQDVTDAAKATLNDNVNSPASRQMLVHHQLSRSTTVAGAPGFRDRFMLALRDNGLPGSLGYPQNLRRVGIADGRLDGGRQAVGTPGGTALQMDIVVNVPRWLRLIPSLFFYRRAQGGTLALADINFSPAYGTGQVFRTQVTLAVIAASGFSVPVTRTSSATSPGGSYDLASGGYYDAVAQIKNQAASTWAYRPSFKNVVDNHCFIPTVSALGYNYQQMASYQNSGSLPDPYTNLSQMNLRCQQNTPFDNVFGMPNKNLKHILEPDAGLQQFLFSELLNKTARPTFAQAPTFICPTQQNWATVRLAQPCQRNGQAPTYEWILSGSLVFGDGTQRRVTTSESMDVYAASGISSGYGGVVVKATRPGALPSDDAMIGIYVGGSPVTGTYSCLYCNTSGTLGTYQYIQPGQYTMYMEPGDYTFTSSSPAIPVTKRAANQASFTMPAGGGVQITATQISTPYGCPKTSNFVFLHYLYRFGPNPTSDVLTVERNQDATVNGQTSDAAQRSISSAVAASEEFTVKFFDAYGQLLATQKSEGKQLKLDVSRFRAGYYNLCIISGKDVEYQHIQVTH